MSCGTILIEVISIRRISPPPSTNFDYIVSIAAGNQIFHTEPACVMSDPFAGHTLTFRERFEIRLNSTYDSRKGLVLTVSSEDGNVHLGSASCAESREWVALSKPRGEVQVVFSHHFSNDLLKKNQRPKSAGIPRKSHYSGVSVPLSYEEKLSAYYESCRLNQSGSSSSLPGVSPSSMGGNSHLHSLDPMAAHSGSGGGVYRNLFPTFNGGGTKPSATTVGKHFSNSSSSLRANRPGSSGLSFPLSSATTSVDKNVEKFSKPTLSNVIIYNLVLENMVFSQVEELPFFVTIQFAQQEKTLKTKLAKLQLCGYSIEWTSIDGSMEFDVPSYVSDRKMVLTIWTGHQPASAIQLASTTLALQAHDTTTTQELFGNFSGQSVGRDASVRLTIQLICRKLQIEGISGRPMSAKIRGVHAQPLSPTLIDHHQYLDSPSDLHPGTLPSKPPLRQPSATTTTTSSKFSSSSAKPSRKPLVGSSGISKTKDAWAEEDAELGIGDDDEDITATRHHAADVKQKHNEPTSTVLARHAEADRILAAITDTLSQTLERALSPVVSRVSALERRIQRNEDVLSNIILSGGGGGGSRPSSAESIPGVVSNIYDGPSGGTPCITQEQMRSKFNEYDVSQVGYLTKMQLIHFYRTHSGFGMDESEEGIVKELRKNVKNLDEDRVVFDDFCAVALRLAKA